MTIEVLASPDTPRNIRYGLFSSQWDGEPVYDVYLIRGDDPMDWRFIIRKASLAAARLSVRNYLVARQVAISAGFRP